MEDDDIANEVSVSVQVLNEAFKDLCHRTWISLMKKELTLFEGTEVSKPFSSSMYIIY